jgi:ribosomal protein S6--L-glutamate ligase
MARICKRCHRANPTEAAYCYHDGTLLEEHGDAHPDQGALDIGGRPFAAPFFLPSGRSCNNYNELVIACRQDPATATAALEKGYLEAFLGAQGRADLALAAHATTGAADRQRALDEFLARLPGNVLDPPRLEIDRPLFDLGILRPGESRRMELELRNEGTRLLTGAATASDEPWLILGEKPGLKRKIFQFLDRSTLVIRIRGRQVRAYPKPQEGEVVLESNGGTLVALVRFTVPAVPFPEGVLAGTETPRQMAEKAVTAPKEAARLIEEGAVARWYQANGWIYPVSGPAATGPAAVQQLFEAIGVSRPPRVEISQDEINVSGIPGGMIESVLAVISQETRPAVAHATSDKDWLQVGKTIYRGRSAMLPLTIPFIPSRPGETLRARVTVAANGNQRFVVPVALTVRGEALAGGRVTVSSHPTTESSPPPASAENMESGKQPTPAPSRAGGRTASSGDKEERIASPSYSEKGRSASPSCAAPAPPPSDLQDLPTLLPGPALAPPKLLVPQAAVGARVPPPPPPARKSSTRNREAFKLAPVQAEPQTGRRSLRSFLLGFGAVVLFFLLAVGVKEGLDRGWFHELWENFRRLVGGGANTRTSLPMIPEVPSLKKRMHLALLCSGTGWHVADLVRAAVGLGHSARPVDFRRLSAGVGPGPSPLSEFDAVIVRTMPPGSLEQVVFRMDLLQSVAARGVPILNSPRALEACVDKYLTTERLAAAGLPVPPTVVCQNADAALEAFSALCGDVVVKPLFGSEGRGMMRIGDPELAWRTFRTLERTGAVLYLQQVIRHPGWDLRVFVLGGRVLGCMRRHARGADWRTNVAQGGTAEAVRIGPAQEDLALRAAAILEADAAGVDLISGPSGEWYVIEVNAVPGWRALAPVTGIDVAAEMVRHLAAKVQA